MQPPTPDIAGFAEAQERMRTQMGVEVTFLFDPVVTWPAGTVLDSDDNPLDPTTQPVASAQASATVTAGLVYHLQLSTTRATDSSEGAIGRFDKSHVVVISSIDDKAAIWGATHFVAHGDVFLITSMKEDEIFGGYIRIMTYGAVSSESG